MFNPFENFMKQAQIFQEDLKKVQQELANLKITGESGGGLVKITTNGNGDTISIEIDESVYKEDKQVLKDLLVAACNDSKIKRERLKNEKLKEFMTKLGLPANFILPFISS